MATDILSLNRVSYSGLDFDTIEDDLRAQLQIKFASTFNDFTVSSLGIVLLDVVSFGLDTLSFYLDRRATDTYLSTARTRRSVALLTRQLGYKMSGAVASSTNLQVGTSQLYAFPIPIPKGFQFYGPNQIIFETAQAVTIPANTLTPVTVPVYQGQTVTENFVSDGTANQVFRLTRVPTSASIVQGSVSVTVNGSPFSESDFITFDATDQFEIGYNDTPPTIRFGDGVAGNIPVNNSSIVVTYVATLGTGGMVLSNTITSTVAPLVVLFTQINLAITNPANTIGGSDLEDLDHAKTFAPLVFKSRRVAITQGDYQALAGSYVDPLFGRVAVAEAISTRTASDDVELQNLLTDITSGVSAASTAITNALNDPTIGAFAYRTTMVNAVTALQTDLTNLLSRLNTVNTNETTALTFARTIKTDAGQIQNDYTDAHTETTTAKTTVSSVRAFLTGLPTNPTTQISSGDLLTLQGQLDSVTASFNKIDALGQLMSGLSSSISAAADSQSAALGNNQSILANTIGLTVSTGISLDMQTQITSILTAAGSSVAPFTGLYASLSTISSNASLDLVQVTNDCTAIFNHVDLILSADCKSNLVSVPILARDAAGFYAAPSIGLIQSLQSYLDGIKEVTQTVKVSSGVNFLIPAAITVRIGISTGISETVTKATATTIIDGVLRDRSFGASLYVSDLDTPLKTIAGVQFVNVMINGYRPSGSLIIKTDRLDANDNLIINSNEVITLSETDLVVNVELAS
jgi:hypothetical protein